MTNQEMRLIFNEYLSGIQIYWYDSFVRNIISVGTNVRFIWGIMGIGFFSDLATKIKGVIPGFSNGKFLLLFVFV